MHQNPFRLALAMAGLLALVACQSGPGTTAQERPSLPSQDASPGSRNYEDLDIVTLLPPDAIPAIDNPQFLTAAEADEAYDPDGLVLGVVFNGEARAYSVSFLSGHEIVNDTVGGVKIAVTW